MTDYTIRLIKGIRACEKELEIERADLTGYDDGKLLSYRKSLDICIFNKEQFAGACKY